MKQFRTEISISQEILREAPATRERIIKKLANDLVAKMMDEYKPGDLIMVRLPREMQSSYDPHIDMTEIRVAAAAEECTQCKDCGWWAGHDAYEITHGDYIRGLCLHNLRIDGTFSPPTYALTCAIDYCSSAKRR